MAVRKDPWGRETNDPLRVANIDKNEIKRVGESLPAEREPEVEEIQMELKSPTTPRVEKAEKPKAPTKKKVDKKKDK
jgi:hypothetical protein